MTESLLTREEFYSVFVRREWPADTPDHIFLGRAVDLVGATIFEDEWSDRDPGSRVDGMLLELAQREGTEPPQEGDLRLRAFADELLRHADPPFPRPSDECGWSVIQQIEEGQLRDHSHLSLTFTQHEWEVSIQLAWRLWEKNFFGFERYLEVIERITAAAGARDLLTYVRPARGGPFVEVGAEIWFSETTGIRFADCRIDLNDPYATTQPQYERAGYLFLGKPGLDAFLNTLSPSLPKRSKPAPVVVPRSEMGDWARRMAKQGLNVREIGPEVLSEQWPDPARRPSRRQAREALKEARTILGEARAPGRPQKEK